MLYFLYQLSDPQPSTALREATPSASNRQPNRQPMLESVRESESPEPSTKRAPERQFDVNSPAFNEAFANAGLLRLPQTSGPDAPAKERPVSRTKRDRPKESKASVGETEAEAPPDPKNYPNYSSLEPSEPSLLRDLPFTLQGLSSTNLVFSDSKTLQLPKTLPVPLVSLLHALAEPCLLYKNLSDFVESSDGGLIGQSFRSALGIELRAYLGLVATLEGQIRRALAQLSESEPRQGIGKAGVTLKRCVIWTREATMGLRLMSLMVESSKYKKGGQIISAIHSFSLTHGDPFVKTFAERLLSHVTRPFYAMLRQWIYDGELSDPYQEFFVLESADKLDDSSGDNSRKGAATSVWEEKYKLNSAMVPSIISDTFAQKIFLIGKSLTFIRHSCLDAAWVSTYSRTHSRELHYGDTSHLERSIDEAYATTMARLIDLMSSKFQLFTHLQALKSYLLLGAGDFIAILLESLSSALDRPANTQYRHTLTAQLEHAVRNSNAQYDDPDVLRRLDSRMLELSHGEIGWDVFTLEYKISTPVDVIVTPHASKQYLKIFNFLWRVKRVEYSLNSTWRRCQTGARTFLRSVEDKVGADWKAARVGIAEMVFWTEQLMYYVLFEVIESSYAELLRDMKREGSTLDDLIKAHDKYLLSITRKGLLGGGTSGADFTGQLHGLLKTILAYRDAVDQLYSFSIAEFTRRQEVSAKIENRTSAGKWGLTERDEEDALSSSTPGLPSNIKRSVNERDTESPLLPLPSGLATGLAEEDVLNGLRQRLTALAGDFKARVNVLLGDLIGQPDADMRWLAMVMNFNDVYQPVRRKKRVAGGAEKSAIKTKERENTGLSVDKGKGRVVS